MVRVETLKYSATSLIDRALSFIGSFQGQKLYWEK
jgi:hypothetical protein